MKKNNKIIITQPLELFPEQLNRLKKIGSIKMYDQMSQSEEEWLERCQGMDIICSGKYGLKHGYRKLKNVFISLPFVGVGWLDSKVLQKNNIVVSSSPGCNKVAVSEYIMGMIYFYSEFLRGKPGIFRNNTILTGVI